MSDDDDAGPTRWWEVALLAIFVAVLLFLTGSALVQLVSH